MMRLSDLAALLHGRLSGPDSEWRSLAIDSRTLASGDLYLALRGERFDGHQFIGAAIEAGATAVIVDHEQANIAVSQVIVADTCEALGSIAALHRKRFPGIVVGVTGSGGKTTVKGMLQEVFAAVATSIATQGNFNNHIGVPLSLLRLTSEQFAVIEMGTSHPGEIAYLTGLVQPDIALVNNVMSAHLGGFGSIAAIAAEKSAIYALLTPEQTAVINLNDAFAGQFITQTASQKQIGFGVNIASAPIPFVTAKESHCDDAGRYHFVLTFGDESVNVQLAVVGKHNINNALATAACAVAAGCGLAKIAAALANFHGDKGRMQVLKGHAGACVVDDSYNANPGSMQAAIDYLAGRAGKTILVFGDMGELGDEVAAAHRAVGAYAAQQGIDEIYCVGEHAVLAASEFGVGGKIFPSKEDLAAALMIGLTPNTTVLVKGSRSSGMERVSEIICDLGVKESC